MKNLRYILAAFVAALSLTALSTSAYAVGDIVDDIGNGAEDIINGAGDAADDILGGDETTTVADAGDVAGDVTTSDDIAAVQTTPAAINEVTTAAVTTAITTTGPVSVNGASNTNPGTGVAAGVSILGAAVAGTVALAAKKRR